MSKPLAKTIIGKDGREYEVCDAEARRTKVQLPNASNGEPDKGVQGQFAVSDGHGGITWLSLTNVREVGA